MDYNFSNSYMTVLKLYNCSAH